MHAKIIWNFLYCYIVGKHVKKKSLNLNILVTWFWENLHPQASDLISIYITVSVLLSKEMMFDKRGMALYDRQGILSY